MSYRDVFRELNRRDITYVVSRKYANLPDDTIDEDGDVDIVLGSDYQDGIAACQSCGFSERSTGGVSRQTLLKKGLKKPGLAASVLITRPHRAIGAITTGSQLSQPENKRHANVQLYRGDEKLDLRDNLAYKSPMNRKRIPVHPSVTQGMLERRVPKDGFYIPTPADELAHIVPHCLFDKEGTFSPYYRKRCEELLARIDRDDEQLSLLTTLLDRMFFDAADLVLMKLRNCEFDTLYDDLQTFSDY